MRKKEPQGGLLALVNHVVQFDFQALLSFDRLQARITSTKSRRFIQVAANDSFRVELIGIWKVGMAVRLRDDSSRNRTI